MSAASVPVSRPSLREGWGGARAVLHGPLRKLVSGQAIGQGADGMAQIAFASVVLFDIGKGATPGRVAAVLAVTLLPFSIVGPFAGVVIDRWDRRRVLVLVSAARAVIAVGAIAVVILQSELLAYIGILLLLSSSRFVLAAKGAALPTTVAAEQLVTANAVSSVAGMVTAFGGAVIGATFVGAAPSAGFVVAGALYALAAVVFTRLPPVGGGDTGITLAAGLRRTRAELADGVRVIVHDRGIRDPLLAVWLHRLLLGAGFILLVLIADRRYHFHTSGYALALAVTGIAALAGTFAAPVLARSHRARALLPAAFPAAAIAALLGGYWPNLPVLVVGLGIAAFAFQVLKTLVDALVGGAATDQVRGRVFAAYDVLYNVAFVLAGLALIPLWHLGRERALMWWLAAAFVAAGLVVASWTNAWPFAQARRSHDRARPPNGWRMRFATCVVGALPVLAFPRRAGGGSRGADSYRSCCWCGRLRRCARPACGPGGVAAGSCSRCTTGSFPTSGRSSCSPRLRSARCGCRGVGSYGSRSAVTAAGFTSRACCSCPRDGSASKRSGRGRRWAVRGACSVRPNGTSGPCSPPRHWVGCGSSAS